VDKSVGEYRLWDAKAHGHPGTNEGRLMWAVLWYGDGRAVAWCFNESEAQKIVDALNAQRVPLDARQD